jgi:predicted DCC family thiol-disulfide oxidoreductase YuxK
MDGPRQWKPTSAADVDDRTILFDGVCVLCSWSVRFVIERDPTAQFRFVPIQSSYGRELATRFGIDVEIPETNAAIVDGIAYFKSDTALAVLSRLSRWSWVRLFFPFPRIMRDWIYDRVARNRYRLFGRTDACLVPTADVTRRFMFQRQRPD